MTRTAPRSGRGAVLEKGGSCRVEAGSAEIGRHAARQRAAHGPANADERVAKHATRRECCSVTRARLAFTDGLAREALARRKLQHFLPFALTHLVDGRGRVR